MYCMFKCKLCGKEFETGRKLGGHAASHNPNTRPKPKAFEDLKKDCYRKDRLLVERGHQCEKCKGKEWMGQDIPLELDHIDGNPSNNDRTNLRLLCPNCHAQTPSWKGRNVGHHSGTDRQKVMARYPSYRK